jgi:hypothetical protein
VTPPRVVRWAGFAVLAEAAVALILAATLVVRAVGGADQHVVNGYGTAAWFAVVGAGVGAGGWALVGGRRWGRGIGVFANVLLLPIAWYALSSQQAVFAVAVAALSVLVLGLLFSPPALRWASDRTPGIPGTPGPRTRIRRR